MTARLGAATTPGPVEPSRLQRAVLLSPGLEARRPRLAAGVAAMGLQQAEEIPLSGGGVLRIPYITPTGMVMSS